jgi:hypothetical protein
MKRVAGLSIPEGWHEVTLARFQEMQELAPVGDDDASRAVDAIRCATGCTQDEAEGLTLEMAAEVLAGVSWMSDLPGEGAPSDRATVGGRAYRVRDLRGLTLGMVQSVDAALGSGDARDVVAGLPRVAAVLFVPDAEGPDEPYTSEAGARRAEEFEAGMSVADAYGAALFFSLFGSALTVLSGGSLENPDYLDLEKTIRESPQTSGSVV